MSCATAGRLVAPSSGGGNLTAREASAKSRFLSLCYNSELISFAKFEHIDQRFVKMPSPALTEAGDG
jgi:hypothetical protein